LIDRGELIMPRKKKSLRIGLRSLVWELVQKDIIQAL